MKKTALSFSILFLLIVLPSNAYVAVADVSSSATRGICIKAKTPQGEEISLYSNSYALVIGISNYEGQGWPDLPGVKKDIDAVKQVLLQNGFEVTTVNNPDSKKLRISFEDFIRTHGRSEANRLLIYLAGHGHTLKQAYGGEMGYIIPIDTPHPDRDRNGFLDKALDMQLIEVYARRIQSRHALFVFDSCFSGSIFHISRSPSPSISHKIARPVRQLITSGSADEKVPDESIFAREFIQGLKGDADLNEDRYITGTELGEYLTDKVINYSRDTQHPQYGKIRDRNLDKGDFVFVLSYVQPEASFPTVSSFKTAQERLAEEKAELEQERREIEQLKTLMQEREKIVAERRRLEAENQKLAMAQRLPESGEKRFTNSLDMKFVLIKPGTFMMGSPSSENGRDNDEKQHKVTLTKGFYMQTTEVTQKQWKDIMGNNPSYFKNCGDDCPVEKVSWNDVQDFLERLNKKEGTTKYRLPNEAEWEYACRAGSTSRFCFGDSDGSLGQYAWYYNNSSDKPHPVAQKQPNAWDLYDMHGNVWEWCRDWHDNSPSGHVTDPKGSASGLDRVIRGGSWLDVARNCRSADRDRSSPGDRYFYLGFRLTRSP